MIQQLGSARAPGDADIEPSGGRSQSATSRRIWGMHTGGGAGSGGGSGAGNWIRSVFLPSSSPSPGGGGGGGNKADEGPVSGSLNARDGADTAAAISAPGVGNTSAKAQPQAQARGGSEETAAGETPGRESGDSPGVISAAAAAAAAAATAAEKRDGLARDRMEGGSGGNMGEESPVLHASVPGRLAPQVLTDFLEIAQLLCND